VRTSQEYLKSLSDGRVTYFEGERVEILDEPLLASAARNVADGYDHWYDPAEGARNPLMTTPRSQDDLRTRVPMLLTADFALDLTYQALMALSTAGAGLAAAQLDEPWVDRIAAYTDAAQLADDRVAVCVTDAKGDRSLPPGQQPDPDAYLRVVERTPDGVLLRGAKLHISGGSFAHDLLVMPTKAMKPGEEAYAVCAAVPVNSPGVSIINTTFAPRHTDTRTFPYSGQHHIPDGFVVFDDVFVPNERIFLDGATRYAAVFAHNLGMWQRLGSLAFMAADADRLVGFAQLVAEANGLAKVPHVTEKISELMIHATMVRAGLEAAIANCETTAQGVAFPSELYTNAAKYHASVNAPTMARHLHDIAGGSLVTAPSVADLENPEIGPALRKYMSTGGRADGEYRLKLFHALRDLTADSYGAWRQVTNLQGGGGLYAQRIVTRRHYPLAAATEAALNYVGLTRR
jgi:4-hydroxybutyryl-CoA dehydratase/vinylacetyl-CoA-Delta-isomerase